jgi:hypothetical protein
MLILVLLCWNSFAEAQLTKLRVGYSAISEVDMPAWVAKETKLFEKNGLDVQLVYFTGGTTAVLALVSGEVPICQVAGPAVVNSALAGSDIVMIAGGATAADYSLISGREITRPEQLKGRLRRCEQFWRRLGFHRALRPRENRFDSRQGCLDGPSGRHIGPPSGRSRGKGAGHGAQSSGEFHRTKEGVERPR